MIDFLLTTLGSAAYFCGGIVYGIIAIWIGWAILDRVKLSDWLIVAFIIYASIVFGIGYATLEAV